MVQIYCPNRNHQLWGTGRGEQRAPWRVLRKRGWVEDTHPHVPGEQMPPTTLRPLQIHAAAPFGAQIPPPGPGDAAGAGCLHWRATGSGRALGWGGLGCAGLCSSLSPHSSPRVLTVTAASVQPLVSPLSHNAGDSGVTQHLWGVRASQICSRDWG